MHAVVDNSAPSVLLLLHLLAQLEHLGDQFLDPRPTATADPGYLGAGDQVVSITSRSLLLKIVTAERAHQTPSGLLG